MTGAIAKKLLLKSGQRASIVGAPDGYLGDLDLSSAGVQVVGPDEPDLDFVQLFVKDKAQLDELVPAAVGRVGRRALLWVCYPKGNSKVKSDLNRDVLWAAMREKGLEGVTLVSIDETWSAMRFKPVDHSRA